MTAPCTPFFNRSGGFGITGSPSTGWTFTKTAETGVAETLATWTVSDNVTAQAYVKNASATDARFSPTLGGVGGSSAATVVFQAENSNDSGTLAICTFNARKNTPASIVARPLYSFQNNGTEVANCNAKGFWTWTTLHTDSSAEGLATWTLDEDTSSSIGFANAVSTNAAFQAMIRGINSGTGSALKVQGRGVTDTGTNPLVRVDGRIGASTSVATRPVISFTNNDVEMAQFTAAGSLLLANPITHPSYTVATLPSAAIAAKECYVSDAAVAPCLAFSNGTNWKRCDNAATTVV